MTLVDVRYIFDFWEDHPPVDAMVAAYLGVKPKPAAPDVPATTSVAVLRAQFPDGLMR